MRTTIEKIERVNLVLLVVCSPAVWGIGGNVISFCLGGLVMQANFWLLKKIVRSVFVSGGPRKGNFKVGLWFLAKGSLLYLLLGAAFTTYPVQPESFAAGVSLLLITCVIVSVSDSKSVGSRSPVAKLP